MLEIFHCVGTVKERRMRHYVHFIFRLSVDLAFQRSENSVIFFFEYSRVCNNVSLLM